MAFDASLKIYLVNLDRATSRLDRMTQVLAAAGLRHERVPAVDGEGLRFPHPRFRRARLSLPAWPQVHSRRGRLLSEPCRMRAPPAGQQGRTRIDP